MFGIGMPEMLLILAIALIVIGPKKLPDLAKSIGRAFAEFRRATAEIKETMEIDGELKSVKKTFEDIDADIKKNVYSGPETPARDKDDLHGPDEKKAEPPPQSEETEETKDT